MIEVIPEEEERRMVKSDRKYKNISTKHQNNGIFAR